MSICELAIRSSIFVAACVLAWWPGNKLVWFVWEAIARYEKIDPEVPSPFVRPVGGLERILYIFGAMSGRYEIIAGWLVMKAFFGWMPSQYSTMNDRDQDKQNQDETLRYYNGALIGNLLSLFVGVLVGLAANQIYAQFVALPN